MFCTDGLGLKPEAIALIGFSSELPLDNLFEGKGMPNDPSLHLIVPAVMDRLGQYARMSLYEQLCDSLDNGGSLVPSISDRCKHLKEEQMG
jgi:hypothetical protein